MLADKLAEGAVADAKLVPVAGIDGGQWPALSDFGSDRIEAREEGDTPQSPFLRRKLGFPAVSEGEGLAGAGERRSGMAYTYYNT